ncbi:MAG: hypothetical protein RL318_1976 [Fibrobacterota bacterium]
MKTPVFLAILATSLCAQSNKKLNELGFSLGWGGPFGQSIQYSRVISEHANVGGGFGLSTAGAMIGVDGKYFADADSKGSVFCGVAASYATGTEMTETDQGLFKEDTATYELLGGVVLTPRVGFRYQAEYWNIYFTVGRGFPIAGGGVRYISGSDNSDIKEFVEFLSIGGAEVSMAMTFRL